LALKRVFLRTNEVAEMLGISPFTIRRYIQLRKLKAVKLEGSYRVRQADLDQFLRAREIETEEELAEEEEEESEPVRKDNSRRRAASSVKTRRPARNPEEKQKPTSARVQTRAERNQARKPVTRDRKEH
jgi:excisionase family DNA binding protein